MKIRAQLGIKLDDLKRDYKITQLIGDIVRQRYRGIIAPSAQIDGANVVLFRGFDDIP